MTWQIGLFLQQLNCRLVLWVRRKPNQVIVCYVSALLRTQYKYREPVKFINEKKTFNIQPQSKHVFISISIIAKSINRVR